MVSLPHVNVVVHESRRSNIFASGAEGDVIPCQSIYHILELVLHLNFDVLDVQIGLGEVWHVNRANNTVTSI